MYAIVNGWLYLLDLCDSASTNSKKERLLYKPVRKSVSASLSSISSRFLIIESVIVMIIKKPNLTVVFHKGINKL